MLEEKIQIPYFICRFLMKLNKQISVFFAFTDVKQALIQWQERIEFAHKLLTLLNSYSPPELRNACIGKS